MTNAGKNIRAGADAFICSWGVISEAMETAATVSCAAFILRQMIPGCVHSEVGVEGKT